MTIEQIKEMVAGNQYDFLRTNPHLAGKIIFLTLGGSHAYGTNVETSDVDVRGCALNSRSDLLGLSACHLLGIEIPSLLETVSTSYFNF